MNYDRRNTLALYRLLNNELQFVDSTYDQGINICRWIDEHSYDDVNGQRYVVIELLTGIVDSTYEVEKISRVVSV